MNPLVGLGMVGRVALRYDPCAFPPQLSLARDRARGAGWQLNLGENLITLIIGEMGQEKLARSVVVQGKT